MADAISAKGDPSNQSDTSEDEELSESPNAPKIADLVELPPGTALTESQAVAMALDRPVRTIVMAGAVKCGKTTLLTSVYDLFQSGPVNGMQFAGSDTLPAFELICHLSRADSEGPSEDTLRTLFEDVLQPEYLHLKVREVRGESAAVELLFTDVSGEMFEHARNSTDECKQLAFLRRASHMAVFLDCEKALLPDKKWGMVQDAKSLIQSCLDSGMLQISCCVTVVWAKCDFFEAATNKLSATSFVEDVETDFKSTFGARIPSLKFHRTAARPTRFPNLKMGFGVREMLNDWISNWPQGRLMHVEPPSSNCGERESERFANRYNAYVASA